jgi:transcription antitermination factor NusG
MLYCCMLGPCCSEPTIFVGDSDAEENSPERTGLEKNNPEKNGTHRWYALYVRSRHERVVEVALQGKGYPAFSPAYSVSRKRAHRTEQVQTPLFPGYVFCQFDIHRRLPILTTSGVVFVVSVGNAPEPLQVAEIASLRTVLAVGGSVRPWPFLKAGQHVRVQAGPLSGAEGKLLHVKGETRLIVSITLLQRSVAVELHQDFVAPVFRSNNSEGRSLCD